MVSLEIGLGGIIKWRQRGLANKDTIKTEVEHRILRN